ncbi:ABC transporter ATP-binding protein [Kordiimonas sp. SCSIO 12610]|uniref:ABC transporter ATP-binding protein n=1 Tax=Kordiimonas sp. SCSIO 12610 TaxID=2829597 RepID=UPI00210ABDD7|nr:ABC transporter ATP-binding protein [Kordiimonas sp. SCSIO 12610]UTW54738.1 ABC transporter ATP-binding protein [Kordiimonas sp. SCSIO 12610]
MLSIKGLSHTYPNGVRALNNINLEIPKGMFGLLGPNGAGKSSLMRTIATLQQPTEGTITFDGVNTLQDPDSLRRILGYLPQDFGVYPRVTAYDMLDHMAILKGINNSKERKEVVEGLLYQTNLFDVRKKKIKTFSGGMRQRFGIAQALIGDPQLIIVDEPTAGLDPEERNRFHNLLAEIGENVVVILSTHIVEDVADLCPNMVIIAGGEIVTGGKPADLVQEIDGKIWKKAINKDELATFKEENAVISSHLSTGRTIIHVLADNEPGDGFEPVTPDLEDVYFATLYRSRNETSASVAA